MNEPKESTRIAVKHDRIPSDNYVTPMAIAKWTLDHAVARQRRYQPVPIGKSIMLEPGCGDNAPFASYASHIGMTAYGIDIREVEARGDVTILPGASFISIPDEQTALIYSQQYDIIATNPPFIYGIEFILRSLDLLKPHGVAAFLMKMSFLATQARLTFFQQRPPAEIHILSKRPSFAHGGTDRGQEYCMLFWYGEAIDQKIRAKYGRITRAYWEENKAWPEPDFPVVGGKRVVVEKGKP